MYSMGIAPVHERWPPGAGRRSSKNARQPARSFLARLARRLKRLLQPSMARVHRPLARASTRLRLVRHGSSRGRDSGGENVGWSWFASGAARADRGHVCGDSTVRIGGFLAEPNPRPNQLATSSLWVTDNRDRNRKATETSCGEASKASSLHRPHSPEHSPCSTQRQRRQRKPIRRSTTRASRWRP